MNTTKPRLLIVMPDDMALLLGHILAEKGHQTLTASDVGDAAETMRQGPVDLVILDAGLAPTHDAPEGNAYEFMREAQAPLLVVTSGGEDRLERISCMPEHQSVEFLHRPVRPDELIGRVRHLLRKSRAEELGDVLTFAGVELNLRTRRVHRGERRIDLGPIEFRLLQHLLHHPREVFSRGELIAAAWLNDAFVDARTVDVHVGRLRKALSEGGEPNLIRTVRSAGYSLDSDD